MKFSTDNRQVLSASVILLYFAPIFFFIAYSIGQMSANKSWTLLSIGLLILTCGTLAFTLLLYSWERASKRKMEKLIAYKNNEPDKEPKVTALEQSQEYLDPLNAPKENNVLSVRENPKELESLQASLKELQEELTRAKEELGKKEVHMQEMGEENKVLFQKVQQGLQDFADYKLFTEEQIKQKNLQLATLQQVIEDQRTEVEKRQDHIYQLDTKIHDLSYEIKTLLYLHEAETTPPTPSFLKIENPSRAFLTAAVTEKVEPAQEEAEEQSISPAAPIQSPQEAVQLLRKCVNVAQKLTGANYYSNESTRYREFSSSHYTIDQRRLFESLRSENAGLILVYSQKENKLLFVNNQSRNLLGWSSEKFVSDFPGFIKEGLVDWKKALANLNTMPESQARLLARTKHGHEVILNCHLGVIPTGLFRNYVIGVLYPT